MDELHMYVDDGNCDTVIAYSPADANTVLCEHQGCSEEDLEGIEWAAHDDDAMISLYCDLYPSDLVPPMRAPKAIERTADGWEWVMTATAKEWVTHHGRGFFSSTEY